MLPFESALRVPAPGSASQILLPAPQLVPVGCGGGFRFAAFDAVVHVAVADGAEGFVVEAWLADGFAQLFTEAVDRFERVGGGGDAGRGGFEELLVAVVDEAGDFAAQDPAGGRDPDDGV